LLFLYIFPPSLALCQGLFEAHPQLQEMFPGGVVQFAQRVAQLPDEVLDNLLVFEDGGLAFAQPGAGAGGGAMPGGMGFDDLDDDGGNGNADGGGNVGNAAGAQVEARDVAAEVRGDGSGDEGDEEEDDENHDAPIFPLRVIRGLMNRIWGAAPAEEDQDGDDSD